MQRRAKRELAMQQSETRGLSRSTCTTCQLRRLHEHTEHTNAFNLRQSCRVAQSCTGMAPKLSGSCTSGTTLS